MKVLDLSIFGVEEVDIVLFFFRELFTSRAHFSLGVLDKTSAEDLNAFIEIFNCKDHAWTRGKCLYFGSSVIELGDETLYF